MIRSIISPGLDRPILGDGTQVFSCVTIHWCTAFTPGAAPQKVILFIDIYRKLLAAPQKVILFIDIYRKLLAAPQKVILFIDIYRKLLGAPQKVILFIDIYRKLLAAPQKVILFIDIYGKRLAPSSAWNQPGASGIVECTFHSVHRGPRFWGIALITFF